MSASAPAPSLYATVSALERHYGGAFVYAPRRWGTADGTIAYRAVFPAAAMMREQLAAERLHLARASWLATGTEEARKAQRDDQRVAYGAAE